MRYKLICCEVFCRTIYPALIKTEHSVFPVFTEKQSHDYAEHLRKIIQQEIDNADSSEFDYILLGYGLCGNSIVGLESRDIPVVVPRAHDCCTIFLGSKEKYRKYFGHRPSCRWTCGGYMETGGDYLRNSETKEFLGMNMEYQELVEKYGEENAQYIMETLSPKDGSDEQVIFIRIPPYDQMDFQEKAKADAEKKGQSFELIQGDPRLLYTLLESDWPNDEFLVVPPGFRIESEYDHDVIIRTVPIHG